MTNDGKEQGSLPVRKRKSPEEEDASSKGTPSKILKRPVTSKAREIRLEQNRKAARESRRRKKSMIEELQRSVIFFSRANGTLKHQNEELTRLLLQAQAQVASIENQSQQQQQQQQGQTGKAEGEVKVEDPLLKSEEREQDSMEQSQAQTVATQAIYESQGFPPAAARAAAQSINATSSEPQAPGPAPSAQPLTQMQPGATMQAMANFQQAAAVAMQTAAQGMQGNPGFNATSLAGATPAGSSSNAQQVFNDTMTAIAMQQAAVAAVAGQQLFQNNPFMAPMIAWQNQQAALAAAAAAPGGVATQQQAETSEK